MAYDNNGIMVENVKDLMDLWDVINNKEAGNDPKLIPVNSCKEVFWICNNGHSWKEKVSRVFSRKNKCLYCSGRLVWSGKNDLQTLYPEIAAEWDFEKNNITPDKISPRDTRVFWWKCKNGHPSFRRSVEHRVNRRDICPYCTGRKVLPGVNDLQTLYPNIAKEWDYDNNGGVLPSEVSPETWKFYNWICPKGHHYSMKVHLRTHSIKSVDCPKCVKAHSTSFPEQAIYYYTKQYFPDALNRYKGLSASGLELDIYIPSWNIGIEYDGKIFHGTKEAQARDRYKYKICKERGIKLIRVCEGDAPDTLFLDSADKIYYIKKRPSDLEMDAFLYSFLSGLTIWSRNTEYLTIDINIKRDRPKILEYLIDTEKSFGALYPDLAKNWDTESNGNLTPYMLTPGSNHEVFFKCDRCGKRWSATISSVTKWKRTLCKKCSMSDNGLDNTKRIVEERGSLANFSKELLNQWDFDANGQLSPFDIPKNYSKKVFWKCPTCGYKWSQAPTARVHLDKISSCPHCSGRVAMLGVDDLQTLYPEIAKEWDINKNNGVLPSEVRPGSSTPRYWICSKHGLSFKTSPYYRVHGAGCSKCKQEKIVEKNGFKIEQYTKDLTYVKTFASLNEAGRSLDISPEAIRYAAQTGALSANYYWKYEGTEFRTIKPDKKHAVVGVNIKTGAIVEFESAREAERNIGIDHTKIMNCCKGVEKYNSAGGYYWHFKGKELIIRKNKTTGIPVVGVNIESKEIVEYESASAAAKSIGLNKSAVTACCKGKRKTVGGYEWKYK